MKRLYKVLTGAMSAFLFIILFTNASTGPGANFSTGYTGAPFDAGYCNNCHGGGNFTPLVSLQLLDQSSQPVTTYVAGASYTLNINVSTSTGLTPNTRYGFQVVAVRGAGNNNAGTWGAISPDYHTVVINNRTYVEHSDRLTSGSISLPWTAPTTGTGNITFYAAGNVVNFSFDPTGDNPNVGNLTIAPSPLPVSWLYFNGKSEGKRVLLEWATTNEVNNGQFLLEKSRDGERFTTLTSVEAAKDPKPEQKYSYTDLTPASDNYYRISQIDNNGTRNTFRTIRVTGETVPGGIAYTREGKIVILLPDQEGEDATVDVLAIDGKKVSSQAVKVLAGHNRLETEAPGLAGIYHVSVKAGSRTLFSGKILVE